MDIIDYIEIPSFERRRDRFKRGITILTGTLAVGFLLEKQCKGVSRSWRALTRGMGAMLYAILEDQTGTRLFTLEGNEPPPLTNSALELSLMGVPPASWAPNQQQLSRQRSSRHSHDGREAPSIQHRQQTHVVVTTVVGDEAMGYGTGANTSVFPSRTPSHAHMLQGPDTAAATPQFFQSTKFFAVLDMEEARELFSATTKVTLRPHEVLFTAGESSEAGIYIVVSGQLGVFVPVNSGGPPMHTNTLRYGESVGDLDVVDGAPRSVTCIALDEGCSMVQLSRPVFIRFVRSHPKALMMYLQQGLGRLWRVAHFMLSDFLSLTLHKPSQLQSATEFGYDEAQAYKQGHRDAETQTSPPSSSSSSSSQSMSQLNDDTSTSALPQTSRSNLGEVVEDSLADSDGLERRNTTADKLDASQLFITPPDKSAQVTTHVSTTDLEEQGGQTEASGKQVADKPVAIEPDVLHNVSRTNQSGAGNLDSNDGYMNRPKISMDANPTRMAGPAARLARPGVPDMEPLSDEDVRAGLQAAAEKLSWIQAEQMAKEKEANSNGFKQGFLGDRRGVSMERQTSYPVSKLNIPNDINPVGPYCRLQPSPSLRRTFEFGQRACLADGWDVVDVEELGLSQKTWARLTEPRQNIGSVFPLARGGVLQEVNWAVGQFYLLLDGHLLAERKVPAPPGSATHPGAFRTSMNSKNNTGPTNLGHAPSSDPIQNLTGLQQPAEQYITETGVIRPGSAISCAAFLSNTTARYRIVALEHARLLGFGWRHLEALCSPPPAPPPMHSHHHHHHHHMHTHHHGSGRMGVSTATNAPMTRQNQGSGRFAPIGASSVQQSPQQPGAGSDSNAADNVYADVDEVVLPLLVAAAAAMGPLIRRFISLGLNRVWLKSGDVAYRQGDDASCLFVVISGRLRLLHEHAHHVTGRPEMRVEEEVGRGEAVGVVWTIAGGQHDTTALCVRDSELVRMSKSAFKIISEDSPMALSRLFSNIARRLVAAWDSRMRGNKVSEASLPRHVAPLLASPGPNMLPPSPARLDTVGSSAAVHASPHRSDIVTIAILPAGIMPRSTEDANPSQRGPAYRQGPPGVASLVAVKRLSAALKQMLISQLTAASQAAGGPGRPAENSVLVLDSTSMGLRFPVTFDRLDVMFYRSKVTSWLSNQEEEARFIILEADYHPTPWSSICVAQADVILLAAAEGATPGLGECEAALVWGQGMPTAAVPQHPPLARAASSINRKTANPIEASISIPDDGIPQAMTSAHPSVAQSLANSGNFTGAAGLVTGVPSVYQPVPPGSANVMPSSQQPTNGRNSIDESAPAPSRTQLLHGRDSLPVSPTITVRSAVPRPHTADNVCPIVMAANAAAAADAASASTTQVTAALGFMGTTAAHVAAFGHLPPLTTTANEQGLRQSAAPTPTAMPPSQAAVRPNPAVARRIELVILHKLQSKPTSTAQWLQSRPGLTRHHHVRLDKESDVARLARWMRGRAVGLVLSGGGSRGLAHLGVLCALEDAGIAIDVVGGTSQGAFMAGLFAQGLTRENLQNKVRKYAENLGSVRHLLADLTLPLISLFSGRDFDDILQKSFMDGPGNIEDLWLPFFCVSTNLSRGEPSIHTSGCLWKLVRASMTIVGLLPPVCSENGDLLVDGGYMNNLPVDVMRGLGVDTVIVVDVEAKDDMGWHNLTPYDGGLSGWRLLWDRWCPVPSWRTKTPKMPRYAQIVNQLTWMTHAHNLKRVNEDYRIDLYLRPPNINSYKLMDFHLMNRIVQDAHRYASRCLGNWSMLPLVKDVVEKKDTKQTPSTANTSAFSFQSSSNALFDAPAVGNAQPISIASEMPAVSMPSPSISCMTQLQNKQSELTLGSSPPVRNSNLGLTATDILGNLSTRFLPSFLPPQASNQKTSSAGFRRPSDGNAMSPVRTSKHGVTKQQPHQPLSASAAAAPPPDATAIAAQALGYT